MKLKMIMKMGENLIIELSKVLNYIVHGVHQKKDLFTKD